MIGLTPGTNMSHRDSRKGSGQRAQLTLSCVFYSVQETQGEYTEVGGRMEMGEARRFAPIRVEAKRHASTSRPRSSNSERR